MRKTCLLILPAGLLFLLPGCRQRGGSGGGDDMGTLAAELDIDRVTINQGTEIMLMDDGDEADRNATVVKGRDGLVRIYVERRDDWENRRIKGALTLLDGDEVVGTFDRERNVSGDSHEDDIDSTINIEVPGDELPGGLDFHVSIHEVEEGSGDVGHARWPEDGDAELDARDPGGPLRIVFVPIEYNADDSGRMPDTSEEQLDHYRNWLTRLYPTADLEFEVGDAVGWNANVSPWGEGWNTLLNAMINYRESEGFDDDVYLYGAFVPAASFASYCGEGCILGLSPLVQSPYDSWGRVSIGVAFPGEEAALTLVHEVGHAHGREHAPCGVDDPDPDYPHSGGLIGVAGWDPIDEQLVQSDAAYDVMSYCSPAWISDYNYEALFDRMVTVSGLVDSVALAERSPWLTAIVAADGSLSAGGGRLLLDLPPGGVPRDAELLDPEGSVVGVASARFVPFSHLPGGLLLFPEPAPGIAALRVAGAVLPLP